VNDTELLNSLRDALKVAVDWQWPISPRLSKEYIDWIDQERKPERRTSPCGIACTCKFNGYQHEASCPYTPVPGDADLRTAAKECAPGFSPCKIDDTIFWMGKDNQMHSYSQGIDAGSSQCTITLRDWKERYAADVYNAGFEGENMQRFWRCEHHPSAIDNWDVWREHCEHGCDKSELRPWDNGTHREP
jgi:hypothetical protein